MRKSRRPKPELEKRICRNSFNLTARENKNFISYCNSVKKTKAKVVIEKLNNVINPKGNDLPWKTK